MNQIVRNTPELDQAITQLERLAISSEPRSPYEDKLTNLVLVLAEIVRHHLQQV